MSKITQKIPICSFCGADTSDNLLIKGIDSYICDFCIQESYKLINDKQSNSKANKKGRPSLTPGKIKKHLDQYVIGQDRAKKLLSIAAYNHYKRIHGYSTDGIEIQKSNVILVGPSGSGKTFLLQQLSKVLDIPMIIADATSLTQAGYVGDDVESILSRLYNAADGDLKRTESGIVYIDEIDKISRVQTDRGRDIGGEGVQQALLKIIEGSKVAINPEGSKKNANSPTVWIDTTNILFICGGAFGAVQEQKNPKSMGVGGIISSKTNIKVTSTDLIKFGMITEFMGRLPVIAQLEPLKEEDLVNILKNAKNSLVSQYQALLKMDGIDLKFSDGLLNKVAEKAIKDQTGARSLRSLMEKIMEEVLFNGPDSEDKEILLDVDAIKDGE